MEPDDPAKDDDPVASRAAFRLRLVNARGHTLGPRNNAGRFSHASPAAIMQLVPSGMVMIEVVPGNRTVG